jgi:hypothetical protein
MGLVWLWGGVDKTVWQPGIGSTASWQGIFVVLVSGLVLVATLLVLKSIPLAERDKRFKIVMIVWLAIMAVFFALWIFSHTQVLSSMRDFFFNATQELAGVGFLLLGIESFLEEPRGQNPGWLYLMVGLYALTWGLLHSLLLRETGLSWTGVLATCSVGLYLLAVSLILRFSSDLYRGKRRGCGNLMTLLAYKTFGMLLLAFYFCVMLVFFGLSFAATTPEMSRFCLYAGWMLLGAGAVWLGVSRIRHWDWI